VATPTAAGTANMSSAFPARAAAIALPSRMDTDVIRPRIPLTLPRWCAGIWSGSSAVSVDRVALTPSWASAQPAVSTGTLPPSATISRPAKPTTMPPSNHGLRRPKREVVRSDMAPKNGLPTSARTAPTDRTVPRAAALSSGAICATRIDRVTTTGVRIVRYAPSCASAIAAISRAGASGTLGVVAGGRGWTVVIAHLRRKGGDREGEKQGGDTGPAPVFVNALFAERIDSGSVEPGSKRPAQRHDLPESRLTRARFAPTRV
jgi:hypothetical protein